METTILCFYHAPCNDGAASAAALQYRLFKNGQIDDDRDIRFCPLSYTTDWGEPFHEHYLENEVQPRFPVKEIYMVDVALSPVKYEQLIQHLRKENRLASEDPQVVCIDHHITMLEKIDVLKEFCDETCVKIGPGLSGATLVWNYFNERFQENLETPLLLQYVADQDIWEWKLPHSHEVNAALNIMQGTVDEMERELEHCMNAPEQWLEERRRSGQAITEMVQSQVNRSARQVADIPIMEGARLLVVNATSFSSELGNHLCEDHDESPNVVALIYSIQDNWAIRCSLRSIAGGRINARQIAQHYGGGGHDHAAGCRFENFEALHAALNELQTPNFKL